jgi:hypothetical protein
VELLSATDLRSLFTSFAHTAWRLESRDAYAIAAEYESFQRYLAGESNPDQELGRRATWLGTVRAATAQGRRIERVRVVPDPLTDYLRYEAWLTKQNIEAGEDIRYLARDRARELGLPHLGHDYWLFDSRRLFHMHFDDEDRFAGLEPVDDPEKIVRANYYRDAAWHYATPFRDWYPAHEHECEPKQRLTGT